VVLLVLLEQLVNQDLLDPLVIKETQEHLEQLDRLDFLEQLEVLVLQVSKDQLVLTGCQVLQEVRVLKEMPDLME